MPLLRILLCVCALGVAVRSQAGPLDQWHSVTNYRSQYVRQIAYGAGTYVFVDGLRIVTVKNLGQAAPDAVYTSVNSFSGVAFGANRFVAVGSALLSSTNGINWEPPRTIGAHGSVSDVIYGNGRFVAIGQFGGLVSSNGLDWVSMKLPPGFVGSGIAAGNGLFVVVGGACVSTDGLSWEQTLSAAEIGFYSIGFGNGTFVAMATGSGDNVVTSTDGRKWTRQTRLEALRPMSVAWGNGYFVTVGGGFRAYSRDAIHWTKILSGTTEYDVEFIRGRFVAGGYGTIYQSDPVVQMRISEKRQLEVSGAPGDVYRIEETGSAWSNWFLRTQVTLDGDRTEATVGVADVDEPAWMKEWDSILGPHRFFRVVKVP